jgi:hypothetical protein
VNVKSQRVRFWMLNLLIAIVCLVPFAFYDGSISTPVFNVGALAVLAAFWFVSWKTGHGAIGGFLWALVWFFSTALVGLIVAISIHGMGPCL